MAETALYLALEKISIASQGGDSSDDIILVKFHSRLRRIERELRMILCFLGQLETRYTNKQLQACWIAEAQRLGCLVEETVDVCIHDLSLGISRDVLTVRALVFLKSIMASHKAFTQLMELEEELEHLSKMKKLWLQVDSDCERAYTPITSAMGHVFYQQLIPDFTNEEPVGFDAEKHELTDRLEHKDGASKIVALYGPAGSGKTTLVRFIYEKQRRHFDCCVWISMSGCSSAIDILTKMCKELLLKVDTVTTSGSRNHALENLIEALMRGGVNREKFLIVFDDMKVKDGVDEVCKIIQAESRIIVISRIEMVATEVDNNGIKLEGLKDAKSLDLFSRVVLGKGREVTEELRTRYEDVMRTFPRCRSLPQVIISLGASLSFNQSIQSTFQHVLDQLKLVSKHNLSLDDTRKCLYVAYMNLPMHLKVCLLYCGTFPAGYLLLHEKLVRLWVAEGFIKKQSAQVEEEIATGYLMELIYWGYLQHADSNELGRVTLRMPIVVHDLVSSICRKEGFGIASEDVELAQEDTNVRCLFTSKYTPDIVSLIHLPHVRTLIFSESAVADPAVPPIHSPDTVSSTLSNCHADCTSGIAFFLGTGAALLLRTSPPQRRRRFRYLTVLELQGYPLEILPRCIAELFNLRYLGLKKTKIGRLPLSVSKLYKMQTLDLECTDITRLPYWIGKLVGLRHFLAGHSIEENDERKVLGVRAPKSLMKLKELQTLETIEASADFLNSVDMLTQLRSLHISNVDRKSWKTLLDKMENLGFLTSFLVSAKHGNEVLDLSALPFKQLKSMELSCCKLQETALDLLSEKVPNLMFLSLHSVTGMKYLKFQVDRFTKLKKLNLRKMADVETLQIDVGSLTSIQVLHVESLEKLNVDSVGDQNKIKSIRNLFFPQLTDHLAGSDVTETSTRASQM